MISTFLTVEEADHKHEIMIIIRQIKLKTIKIIIMISAFDSGRGDEGSGGSQAWGENDTGGKGYC